MIEAPTCSICNEKQVVLPEPTERQALPVFVCIKKVGKQRMPCDGGVALIAKYEDDA